MRVCRAHATASMWRSKNNLGPPRAGTHIVRPFCHPPPYFATSPPKYTLSDMLGMQKMRKELPGGRCDS